MSVRALRIVHVIQDIPPSSGGPTSAVLGLAGFQCRMGDVASIACAGGATGSESVRVDVVAGRPGPSPRRRLAEAWRRERPDIVHLHGVWDPVVRAAAHGAAEAGIPWVLSSHGMLHPETLARRRVRKSAYLAIFGHVIRGARHVLALNREESDNINARFRVLCSVIPAGVEIPDPVPSSTGAFRASIPALGTSPFVLFIGRLDAIKGIDLLIDAFAEAVSRGLPHHLVIAGPDFGEQRSIEARICSLGLGERIHLIGALWADRKRDALAECDAFVHRPRYEGYGLAAVEAMAAGKPVLTTARCRLDAASSAGAICLAPDTTSGFAGALCSLAGDPAVSCAQAHAGRAWAIRHAGWPALGNRVREVYDGIVGSAR